jgi:hypothetical protein
MLPRGTILRISKLVGSSSLVMASALAAAVFSGGGASADTLGRQPMTGGMTWYNDSGNRTALAYPGAAGSAAVSPGHAQPRAHIHLTPTRPRRMGAASAIPGPLIDNGGPVQSAPRVYVDFWGWTSDPSGEQGYLTRFLSSVGGNSWLATVSQYGGGWSGDLLAGTWSDNSAIPASPSDAQIQQEAVAAANHFGTGTSVNVQIIVATPTGHSTPGFGSSFCAYHGTVGADPNVTFTDLPYLTDVGASCGEDSVNGSSGTLDGVSIVEGHELAETITDPLLNAWLDASGYEIGDKCAWTGLANITTSSGSFAVQPLWSNADNGCVLAATGGGLAVATNRDGRLEAFGTAAGGVVYHAWQWSAGGSWSGWSQLASTSGFTSVAVATNSDGRLEVFGTGAGGVVYHAWQWSAGGSWSGWSQLASDSGFTSLAVATNSDGRLEVFGTGAGGVVYHAWQWSAGGSWSGWSQLASNSGFISLAAATNSDGRLEVFAATGGATVDNDWQVTAGGSWHGWSQLSGSL